MTRLKGLLAIAAAFPVLVQVAQGQRPVRPPFSIDSVSSEQFRTYLRSLSFAPDTESGDHQALLLGHYPDSAQLGPLATILPEERAYLMSPARLAGGTVIARITSESADSYPRLGLLPHGTTYWWVEYKEHPDTGRSVFVAVDPDSNIIARTVRGLDVVKYHTRFRPREPLARFSWTVFGEVPWGWCGTQCCRARVE